MSNLDILIEKRNEALAGQGAPLTSLGRAVVHYESEEAADELVQLRQFANKYAYHFTGCSRPYRRKCPCGFNQERERLASILK